MKPRERLQTVLAGGLPDCVPVAPDCSNMIPARLTGKPFWELYLHRDPPIWEAYIDCAKHFDIDALMDGYIPFVYPCDGKADEPERQEFIVYDNEERIVTQRSWLDGGKRVWDERVDVYYLADPPTRAVEPAAIGLPPVPRKFRPLEGVRPVKQGVELLADVLARMGDQGLVGVFIASTCVLHNEEEIYDYYDHPGKYRQRGEREVERVEERFAWLQAQAVQPDFLCVGGSGSLVFQSVEMLREIALPAVKRAIELAAAAGMPTHVHCCGPERELVRIMAEETALTVIDPLETPPMGDCELAELKRLYGDRLVLKGNLHTTEVMLRGSVDAVRAASRQAIDDAGAGGRFILSTGDQCGRDTPDANLHAMVETARTYGRYDRA